MIAGMPQTNTVGAPGPITGPPTWGTGPSNIGQTWLSPIIAAGMGIARGHPHGDSDHCTFRKRPSSPALDYFPEAWKTPEQLRHIGVYQLCCSSVEASRSPGAKPVDHNQKRVGRTNPGNRETDTHPSYRLSFQAGE
jgi:hypothetical protein